MARKLGSEAPVTVDWSQSIEQVSIEQVSTDLNDTNSSPHRD
jgi:hypothetical protein